MSHDRDETCRCVPVHRPPVLELHRHHILPTYLGGPDTEANIVFVCPSSHSNIHELLRMMLQANRALTETELEDMQDRPVSRYAGVLARRGFLEFKAHLSGGRSEDSISGQ